MSRSKVTRPIPDITEDLIFLSERYPSLDTSQLKFFAGALRRTEAANGVVALFDQSEEALYSPTITRNVLDIGGNGLPRPAIVSTTLTETVQFDETTSGPVGDPEEQSFTNMLAPSPT